MTVETVKVTLAKMGPVGDRWDPIISRRFGVEEGIDPQFVTFSLPDVKGYGKLRLVVEMVRTLDPDHLRDLPWVSIPSRGAAYTDLEGTLLAVPLNEEGLAMLEDVQEIDWDRGPVSPADEAALRRIHRICFESAEIAREAREGVS